MTKAYFLTGTDTDAGKTTMAAGLLYLAQKQQLSTLGMKPIASGSEVNTQGLRNSDALALMAQSSIKRPYQEVNPYAFVPAIAPHIAAKEAGIELKVSDLYKAAQIILHQQADFTLIEGAGGWRVPINNQAFLSDLAIALNLPVILVVGVKLGCINHALLTAQAISSDGLKLAGWVANVIDPNCARLKEVLATLKKQISAPCLGQVPYLEEPSAEKVASYLSINTLL
ncbi:dethiobiotin synthase [Marinospirillum insulare]|uniref:ATP-dependent dethiobiotin synthetase BioD n=1 Tax=Marinospirillum insulare TaxID=217169 RepID=A0ABQ6A339_9GAMM|nr:dethiobiotin synthase [Marinospirillum insulare]GLR64987.1 ATP-dependent dethiobiotin synthetase BioD [Marinospirillum insulare]